MKLGLNYYVELGFGCLGMFILNKIFFYYEIINKVYVKFFYFVKKK